MDLYNNVMIYIPYLETIDILRLTKVSTKIRKTWKRDHIWKILFKRDFPGKKIIFDSGSYISTYMKAVTDNKLQVYAKYRYHRLSKNDNVEYRSCKTYICEIPLCSGAALGHWCAICERIICLNHIRKIKMTGINQIGDYMIETYNICSNRCMTDNNARKKLCIVHDKNMSNNIEICRKNLANIRWELGERSYNIQLNQIYNRYQHVYLHYSN